ncbi:hypothetical protein Tco_1467032, partial [Tanacetum coccineum]
MFKVFNRCLTIQTSGHDQTKINILQLFHAVVNRTNVDYAALLWWDFMNCVFQKKDVIQYPQFTKLIIAGLMNKYPSIPQRLDEDYRSIKDDIPLVNVYSTGNVLFRGMRIPAAFLTNEIRATDDYKEYDTVFVGVVEGERYKESYADKFAASMLHDDVDDSGDRIKPGSHKEHLKFVDDDDDDNEEEKTDEKKDDEMGSLDIRTEKMQTPIPTPPRSPRIILSSDKNLNQELTRVVADTVIQERDDFQAEVPALISKEFDTHAPMIIEELFKQYVQHNVIQVHPTITTSTDTTSSADLQQQLYSKMKRSLQDQANDPALWERLKRKFEKSSTSNTSYRDDDFHSQHHDDHQDDDAPTKGEKRVKRHKQQQHQQQEWDAWEEETIIDEYEVIPEDKTPELIIKLQHVDKRVPTMFDRARME